LSFEKIKPFAISIAKNLEESYDLWSNNGTHVEQLLKSTIVDFLCMLQDEKCLKKTNAEFLRIPGSYFANPTKTVNPLVVLFFGF
jgi:hypothetical protein